MATECLFRPTDSIMLYSDTGGGKTAQIGEAAEHVALTTGKKTHLWTADRGGVETVRPHIDAGLLDVQSLLHGDPWLAVNAAACGKTWDDTKKAWIPLDLQAYGLLAFEGLASMAELVRIAMTKENAEGRGVGGKAAFTLKRGTGTDAFAVSSSTMVDYSVVQAFMTEKAWQSQGLGLPILWTTHIQRSTDEENNAPVVGPVVAGKALTTVVPRWFTYTFRLEAVPVPNGRPRHLLYIEEHSDTGLKGFGNARIPLASVAGFKPILEPASIVEAMKSIRLAQASASATITNRLKAAGVNFK
jgi:hypothetical protein